MKARFTLAVALAFGVVFFLVSQPAQGQSLTQGEIRGAVTDPSGAVVTGATVTLQSNTGQTFTRTSNATGLYNFPLLAPGTYTLTVSAPNYKKTSRTVAVSVGQSSTINVQLPVETATQEVTVTAESGVIQTVTPSLTTTMSNEQIQLVPNGGGDLSYIAQTAPGSVMNSQGGYGNFSSNGLPANSNNFTVNSMPENDPFLNLNNSGATNILLGQNDVDEASVVTNGYSGAYSMAGANVNYVSKQGTNTFHGNASWRWNGRKVNANSYFNKQNDPPTQRGFVNDNMWAASFGGPIRKDKTFFFANTEGLYVIVPVSRNVNVPTQQFQQATLANLAGTNPSEVPLYQSMFNIYNNAPGSSSARNILSHGGCADFNGTAGFGDGGTPCALRYNSTVAGKTHEWLVTGRVDHNFTDSDKAFVHFRMDRGVQATYTDPLNPIFNLESFQPQYEGQLQEVHSFGTNTVNSFSLNGSYYRAIFQQADPKATLAFQPVEVAFSSGALFPIGRNYSAPSGTPQGRNVTQYGFVDDLSHTMGNHTFKLGANFSRYDVTTYGPGIGSLPLVSGEGLTDFFNGLATNFTQAYPTRLTQPVTLYNLGFYGEDVWHAASRLSLTFALRFDRNSNPACNTDCFNRFTSPFTSVDHSVATPYNQTILSNQHLALPDSYHPWTIEPRFGFNFSPFGVDRGLVISGGFGIFNSTLPAGFVDSLINNLPGDPSFTVGGLPFGPTTPGNGQSATAAAAAALRTGFADGSNFNDLNNAVMAATGGLTGFSSPNFFNVGSDIHTPRFQEWDLQVQKQLGAKMSLSLKYVGNHGIWQQINNTGQNAYCGLTNPVTMPADSTTCLSPASDPTSGALPFSSFSGLPTSPMDARFLNVTEISSGYNSNYNGFTASFMRRISALQFQFNYTWSHALDFVSNGGQGITPYNFDTNTSITAPQNPFNVRQNMYGNADYDIRHYFSANYVYTTPRNAFNGNFLGHLLGDWTIAGTLFARTGMPFTVIDTSIGGALTSFGYDPSGVVFADQTGASGSMQCGSQYANAWNGQCPALKNNFAESTTGFGNQRRNQVYGPHFFDTDLTLTKGIPIPKWEHARLQLGVTAYNLFNHPNFDQPVADVTDPSFGTSVVTVNAPTSIYGSFLGADASPRLIQTQLKLTF
ncbi:MAG TPA: carboxypeptidase regulatory-like domain-containing protein [Terriglobales bacterium]|nr:carboxypeptidase regulatory-like domain-containing protein [Terriglobales bacterium]